MIEFTQSGYTLTLDSTKPIQFSRDTPVQVALSDDTFTDADDLSLNFVQADGRNRAPARVQLAASGTDGVYTGKISKSALLHHGLVLVALGGIVTSTGQVITSAAAHVMVYQSVDPELQSMPDSASMMSLIRSAVDDYAGEHGLATGATVAQAAQIEKNAQDIAVLGATEPVDINDISLWEQGHIKTADGTDGASGASSYPVKIRTIGYLSNVIASAKVSGGAFKVFRYDLNGVYVDNISSLINYSDFDFDTYQYRIELTYDAATDIDVSFYDHIRLWTRYNNQLADALTRVKTVNGKAPDSDGDVTVKMNTTIPTVAFDFDHDMRDVSGELASMDYSNKSSQNDVLEQVHTLFDGLAEDYPDYVSRVDAAEIAGLTYPAYANGVSGSSTYEDTPAYKTYLYKFVCSNSSAGNDESGKLPKQKMLVISGIHGNEIAAPFNCYLFAKQLCSGVLNDPNFFKLRAAFDVYILPCLNGYGMYHVQRGNANGVNLNRNFPVDGWSVSGEDTKGSANECDYTGESAGCEFETQLVMEVTDYLEPDIVIDHHNYARLQRQFYTSFCDAEWIPLAYQALVDCSIAFKKHFPSYFGTGFDLIVHDSGSAPGSVSGTGTGTANRWFFEHGIPFSSTVEISECINYVDGVYSGEKNDNFGADTFSVAEYTLRNLILHYCQWVLDHR